MSHITTVEEAIAYVKDDGMKLKELSEDLGRNKQVVLSAVQHSGKALQFVDDPLLRDYDVILAAVRQNGSALMYTYSPFLKDRRLVTMAKKVPRVSRFKVTLFSMYFHDYKAVEDFI